MIKKFLDLGYQPLANKYLKSIVDFQVERYDKLVELYEEIEGDNHPGFQELSDIMDKLGHAGLCKNTKYWSSKDYYPD